jgi:hypothetical protein
VKCKGFVILIAKGNKIKYLIYGENTIERKLIEVTLSCG